ncbi:MAG: hypothetical protein G01um101420_427 [Parcubacteria group bacterium Gr01-1014_20]|nr:MAG: hypothetical protein G01um101420_427 [Parcubacteria group bacterium Gr01-1014_20]
MAFKDLFVKSTESDVGSGTPEAPPRSSNIAPSTMPPARTRRTFLAGGTPSKTVVPPPSARTGLATAKLSVATPDPEFLRDFEDALKGVTKRGYAEFLQQKTTLGVYITEEDKLIPAALNSVHGVRPNEILASVRECIQIVENLNQDFGTQLETEARGNAQDKNARLNAISKEVTAHEQSIRELQEEIAALKTEEANLQNEVGRIDTEKEAVGTRIKSAYDVISGRLSDLASAISAHI